MALKKKKILFIEDEPDQIMMVSLRLKKNGFSVSSAQDGLEGVEQAIKEKPDLILLDLIMPGMDGFEVCRKLRQHHATKRIPIIAATAAGADDLEHQCMTAGANECIRKPYEAMDLLAKIHKLLEK